MELDRITLKKFLSTRHEHCALIYRIEDASDVAAFQCETVRIDSYGDTQYYNEDGEGWDDWNFVNVETNVVILGIYMIGVD